MTVVNMLDAKTRLSQLVDAVESGVEAEVIIARNGRPAARLTRLAARGSVSQRIGVAKGRFKAPEIDPTEDAMVAAIFTGKP